MLYIGSVCINCGCFHDADDANPRIDTEPGDTCTVTMDKECGNCEEGTDNPPYITIVNPLGVYHVNRMDYDPKQDSYVVSVSKQVKDKESAYVVGADWAKRDGLEIR